MLIARAEDYVVRGDVELETVAHRCGQIDVDHHLAAGSHAWFSLRPIH